MARCVLSLDVMMKHAKTAIAPEEQDRDLEVALRLEPIPVRPEETSFATRVAEKPSRRLMLASLADAVSTFRRTAALESRDDARTFAETAHWFASDDASEPFGFVRICHELGLDAAYLRQGLKSLRTRARLARHAHVLH